MTTKPMTVHISKTPKTPKTPGELRKLVFDAMMRKALKDAIDAAVKDPVLKVAREAASPAARAAGHVTEHRKPDKRLEKGGTPGHHPP